VVEQRFRFFAVRSNPDGAPLTISLNGGVSCFGKQNLIVKVLKALVLAPKPWRGSSVIGLFQEYGSRLTNQHRTTAQSGRTLGHEIKTPASIFLSVLFLRIPFILSDSQFILRSTRRC
jgi:hypothetical protein